MTTPTERAPLAADLSPRPVSPSDPATSAAAGSPQEPSSAVAGPALDVVLDLADRLETIQLPLELPDAATARALQHRIQAQLRTHLIPRLEQASLPTLVVVGGPTGSGKSTLVNALAGAEVSPAGVVRPTTRRPVLVANPADAALLSDHPVLSLAGLVEADIPRGLALLDAPDLDSVEEGNRALAVELVEAADVWLFVTTANRYGDAVPWEVLAQVRRRGITVAVVLDRVGPQALDTVRRDLLQRLTEAGFGSVPLFIVPDAGPLEGPLPAASAEPVAQWLALVASRAGSREVVRRTVRGVWSPLRQEVRTLLDAVVAQTEAAADLTAAAGAVLEPIAEQMSHDLAGGVLLEGAPTTRWLAGVSSRGVLEPVAHEVSGLLARRRIGKQAEQRTAALAALDHDLRAAFDDVVGQAAGEVATRVAEAWSEHSAAGAELARERSADDLARARRERLATAWESVVHTVAAPPGLVDAVAGLDAAGARTLVLLAGAGLTGAVSAVRRLTGSQAAGSQGSDSQGSDRGQDAIVAATAAWQRAARQVLEGEALDQVRTVSRRLDAEAATRLRVRVGELRRLAGED